MLLGVVIYGVQLIALVFHVLLAPLLATADLAAIGVAAQLVQSLALSPWVDTFDTLQGQIGNMDFAAARTQVDDCLQRLTMPPGS